MIAAAAPECDRRTPSLQGRGLFVAADAGADAGGGVCAGPGSGHPASPECLLACRSGAMRNRLDHRCARLTSRALGFLPVIVGTPPSDRPSARGRVRPFDDPASPCLRARRGCVNAGREPGPGSAGAAGARTGAAGSRGGKLAPGTPAGCRSCGVRRLPKKEPRGCGAKGRCMGNLRRPGETWRSAGRGARRDRRGSWSAAR